MPDLEIHKVKIKQSYVKDFSDFTVLELHVEGNQVQDMEISLFFNDHHGPTHLYNAIIAAINEREQC